MKKNKKIILVLVMFVMILFMGAMHKNVEAGFIDDIIKGGSNFFEKGKTNQSSEPDKKSIGEEFKKYLLEERRFI